MDATETRTEKLTDDMIRALRDEAAAGDEDQVRSCEAALRGGLLSRAQCAAAITRARAMDEDGEFVRVVA